MMEREACRRKYGKVNPVTDNMMCARAEGAGKEIGRAISDTSLILRLFSNFFPPTLKNKSQT